MIEDTNDNLLEDETQEEEVTEVASPSNVELELANLRAELEQYKSRLILSEINQTNANEPEEEELDEDELEAMTRAEFSKLQQDKLLKAVEKQLGPSLESVKRDITAMRAQSEIERVAAKYPDFWDHKDVMYKIAQENPSIDAESAYAKAVLISGKKNSSPKTLPATTEKPTGETEAMRRNLPDTEEEMTEQAWNDTIGKGGLADS